MGDIYFIQEGGNDFREDIITKISRISSSLTYASNILEIEIGSTKFDEEAIIFAIRQKITSREKKRIKDDLQRINSIVESLLD